MLSYRSSEVIINECIRQKILNVYILYIYIYIEDCQLPWFERLLLDEDVCQWAFHGSSYGSEGDKLEHHVQFDVLAQEQSLYHSQCVE